jgi:hypothetical protein
MVAGIVGETVTCDVTNVIKDDGVRFAGRWTQDAADLLEVKRFRLSGPEQDGDRCTGTVKTFGDDINSDEDINTTGG